MPKYSIFWFYPVDGPGSTVHLGPIPLVTILLFSVNFSIRLDALEGEECENIKEHQFYAGRDATDYR